MVNIFGTSDSKGKNGVPGPPGPPALGEIVQLFPDLISEQTKKKLNSLTLLIETIPPAKNADVEVSAKNRVTIWKPFNDRKSDYFLQPVDHAGELRVLTYPDDDQQRNGIVFNRKRGTMYYMENCPSTFLSVNVPLVLVTMTFLVGDYHHDSTEYKENNSEEEEFIFSDYHWSLKNKSPEKFRGVSVISRADKKFALYLHGARGQDGSHILKIGDDLEKDLFYTLQVCWRSESNCFYLLHKNGAPVIDKTLFHGNSLPFLAGAAFYLGGFNASTEEGKKIVKSKCFTGVISNLEIIKIDSSVIPEELLNLIRISQEIINPWKEVRVSFPQGIDTQKSEINPPNSKKRKIT